jgi:hypothetical protein
MEKEWPAFTDSDCCQRTFVLDFLPAGLFARFMIRMLARRPKRLPKFVWRNGLLVVMKSKSILLELLSAQRKIQVAVR